MERFPSLFSAALNPISPQAVLKDLLKTNEHTAAYGLTLSPTAAVQLIEARRIALSDCGRVELGSDTILKLIDAFSPSAYVQQNEYADTLETLLETFYYMKNETLDEVPDDELIQYMKDYFETRCRGSLELLQHRDLEQMARNVRFGDPTYGEIDDPDAHSLDSYFQEDYDDFYDKEDME